jgi:transcriptional regulator with GAF, ATPase, and Fis domain/tetratricopeptide (TPR) repeat protein
MARVHDLCQNEIAEYGALLLAWEAADVALPLKPASAGWLGSFLTAGLVATTPRGYVLTFRGRVAVWKTDDGSNLVRPQAETLIAATASLSALRKSGRWQDLARFADALMTSDTAFASRLPHLPILAALGYAQVLEYDHARELLECYRDSTGWNSSIPVSWRPRLSALHAFVLAENGDAIESESFARESATMARGTPDRVWSALVTAWSCIKKGRHRKASRLLLAVANSRMPEHAWIDSIILSWLGTAEFYLEGYDQSALHFEEALAAATRSGWEDRKLAMLKNVAMNDLDLRRLDDARPILFGLKNRHEKHSGLSELPGIWTEIARFYGHSGSPAEKTWASYKAIRLGTRTQCWLQVVFAHMSVGSVARASGQWKEARVHYRRARDIARRINLRFLVGTADFQLSRVEHYAGYTSRALQLLVSASRVFEETGQPTRVGDCHRQATEFLLEKGLLDAAERELHLAKEIFSRYPTAREADWVNVYDVELRLRRAPGSIREEDLVRLKVSDGIVANHEFDALGITAIGFALLGHWPTAQHYARKTLRKSQTLSDMHLNRRLLDLIKKLDVESGPLNYLFDYWEARLRLPDSGKEIYMKSRRKVTEVIEGDRWLTAHQFNEIASLVATVAEPEALTDRILRFAKEQLSADRVALFTVTPDGQIDVEGALGADGRQIDEISAFSSGVLQTALDDDGLTRIVDAQVDPVLSKRASIRRLNVRSVLAAPLTRQGRVIGLLYADTLSVPGAFVDGDHEILRGLAHMLAASLEQSQRFRELEHRSAAPRRPGSARLNFPGVVADSRRMQKILRLAMKIARSEKTVILTGEPGTGKEVIADLIQQHSYRAEMPYLKINCAAVPEANLESELFGVAAGAFTGVVAREGMFELANGGTLFLDEIGEMSKASQAKLLRVLEEHFVRRVGGKRMIAVDVRVLAATNTDLVKAVEEERFRKDLYDRLNQFTIHVAPLREHKDDIPGLAVHFLQREREREHIRYPIEIEPAIVDWLMESPLHGNARELANIIGKMVALDSDGVLDWGDLPPDLKAVRELHSPKFDKDSSFDNLMAIAEATILKRALDNSNGRIRKAARHLSMAEATLRRRLKMLDLHMPTRIQMIRPPVRRRRTT